MRPAVVIAATVALTASFYFFGPDLAELVNKSDRVPVTTGTVAPKIAPAVIPPSLPATTKTAPAPGAAKQFDNATKPVPAAAKPQMALRRKARPEASAVASEASSHPSSPFVAGYQRSEKLDRAEARSAAVSSAKIARHEKNFSNPMEGRWVQSLSGSGARLDMGKKSEAAPSCAVTNATPNCERKPAPTDLIVAGVVVKKERILKTPAQPLNGAVRAGHYLDETPAVYVE